MATTATYATNAFLACMYICTYVCMSLVRMAISRIPKCMYVPNSLGLDHLRECLHMQVYIYLFVQTFAKSSAPASCEPLERTKLVNYVRNQHPRTSRESLNSTPLHSTQLHSTRACRQTSIVQECFKKLWNDPNHLWAEALNSLHCCAFLEVRKSLRFAMMIMK